VKRYFHDIEIAIEALLANKLKSVLTALGILFGVAAVISMLAIGQGAQQEIIEQIELIGSNNILVEAHDQDNTSQEEPPGETSEDGREEKTRYSPGLSMDDLEALKTIVPVLDYASPEILLESEIIYRDQSLQGNGIGVTRDYFHIYNLKLTSGSMFSDLQEKEGKRVCVIGSHLASRLFRGEDPLGQSVKFGGVWLKVIGVLQREQVASEAISEYGYHDVNTSVFLPGKTLILRIMNRKLLGSRPASQNQVVVSGGSVSITKGKAQDKGHHQLDKIVMKVEDASRLGATARLVERVLSRRHNGVKDFNIVVPEILLRQKQETKEIFNFVLGAIAGISLLVGGIGIMNIMFATVMERIREIGIRMAIGAKKKDILVQFMTEALLISLIGGLLGIVLGVTISGVIERLTEIQTIVTPGSILVAFLVSATVGVVFGYSPARRAASKDPIESLRHE
jgi:putative ABC transport system permease protein